MRDQLHFFFSTPTHCVRSKSLLFQILPFRTSVQTRRHRHSYGNPLRKTSTPHRPPRMHPAVLHLFHRQPKPEDYVPPTASAHRETASLALPACRRHNTALTLTQGFTSLPPTARLFFKTVHLLDMRFTACLRAVACLTGQHQSNLPLYVSNAHFYSSPFQAHTTSSAAASSTNKKANNKPKMWISQHSFKSHKENMHKLSADLTSTVGVTHHTRYWLVLTTAQQSTPVHASPHQCSPMLTTARQCSQLVPTFLRQFMS